MIEKTKVHHAVGNQYAAKDQTADTHVQVRVTREEKEAWVKQAQAQGLKLSAWIRQKLNPML